MPQEIKKILFLAIDFPPMGGGMSRHSLDAVSALARAGESPLVITAWAECAQGRGIVRMRGIKSNEIFDNYLKSVVLFFFYSVYHCLTKRVKAVLANTWSVAGVAAFLIKKTLGIPYFVFAHGLDVYSVKDKTKVYWLMRLVLKNASTVIANSSFTAQLVRSVIGQHGRVEVSAPAVDVKRFGNPDDLDSPVKPGNDSLLEAKNIILTVGRLVESKNYETMIRAFSRVIKDVPRAEYRIIGEGPLRPRLKELVRDLGLEGKVIFLGNVPDAELAAYYHSCDVFVLASREIKERGEAEGFGIVFLEAGACARPVIGAKSGGIPDAVVDGVTGLLVDPSNENKIAQAIVRLLQDEELARRLGENAKKRVESEFNIESFGGKLKRIING